jgi:TonB family protein
MLKIISSLCLVFCVFVSSAQDNKDEGSPDEPSKRPSWSSGLPERQTTTELNKQDFKPEIDDIELDMSGFGVKPKAEIEIDLPMKQSLPGTINTEEQVEADLAEQELTNQKLAEQERVAQELAAQELAAQELAAQELAAQELAAQELAAQELAAQELAEQELAEQMLVEQELAKQEEQSATQMNVDSNSTPIESNAISAESPVPSSVNTQQEELGDKADYNWAIVKQAPVDYPVKAAIANLEGWVEVEITINPAGEVVSASALNYSRNGRVFGKPAVQSVNNWLFEPPSNFGITENISRIYKVEFNL